MSSKDSVQRRLRKAITRLSRDAPTLILWRDDFIPIAVNHFEALRKKEPTIHVVCILSDPDLSSMWNAIFLEDVLKGGSTTDTAWRLLNVANTHHLAMVAQAHDRRERYTWVIIDEKLVHERGSARGFRRVLRKADVVIAPLDRSVVRWVDKRRRRDARIWVVMASPILFASNPLAELRLLAEFVQPWAPKTGKGLLPPETVLMNHVFAPGSHPIHVPHQLHLVDMRRDARLLGWVREVATSLYANETELKGIIRASALPHRLLAWPSLILKCPSVRERLGDDSSLEVAPSAFQMEIARVLEELGAQSTRELRMHLQHNLYIVTLPVVPSQLQSFAEALCFGDEPDWASRNVVFMSGPKNILRNVMNTKKRAMVLACSEQDLFAAFGPGSTLLTLRIRRVDVFSYETLLHARHRTQLLSYFGPHPPDIHVHVPDLYPAAIAYGEIHTLSATLTNVRHNHYDWMFDDAEQERGIPTPLITLPDGLPPMEPVRVETLGRDESLSLCVARKCLWAWKQIGRRESHFVAMDCPSSLGTVYVNLYTAEDTLPPLLDALPWTGLFVRQGVPLTGNDHICLARMLCPLQAIDDEDARRLLRNALDILKETMEYAGARNALTGEAIMDMQDACRRGIPEDACRELLAVVEAHFPMFDDEEEGEGEEEEPPVPDPVAAVKDVVWRHAINPRFLIMMVILLQGGPLARAWVWPKLVLWRRLHAWCESAKAKARFRQVHQLMAYMVSACEDPLEKADLQRQHTELDTGHDWF